MDRAAAVDGQEIKGWIDLSRQTESAKEQRAATCKERGRQRGRMRGKGSIGE